MSVFIEDSPRAFMGEWIVDTVTAGPATGTVITPWATPWATHSGPGRKPSARTRARDLAGAGVDVWFDASTHALQMGGVGDFRYYDEYDLWGGTRGDLSTPAAREEHVRKTFGIQTALSVPRLGPTILLHAGLSGTSAQALELAREAVQQDPGCWLSVAGTPPFWASGAALDAHIGAMAALEPAGWFLTVVRPTNAVPVEPDPQEVAGLCRSTRALSEDAPVHVSHGDFAGLPAIAAGAATVGSGWDKRQRVCAYVDYAARTTGGGGGGWYERASLRRLLGSLSVNESEVLNRRDAARATRLGGLPVAPGPREAFIHHVDVLGGVVDSINAQPDYERKYRLLIDLYDDAFAEWPGVETVTSCTTGANEWIARLADGLAIYGHGEGW